MVILNGNTRHGAIAAAGGGGGGKVQLQQQKSSSFFLTNRFLMHILSGLCCFYAGLLVGMSSKPSGSGTELSSSSLSLSLCPKCPKDNNIVAPIVNCPELEAILDKHRPAAPVKAQPNKKRTLNAAFYDGFSKNASQAVFPPTLATMVMDYGTVDRVEFLNHLDIGIPIDGSKTGSEDVLLLYASEGALPNPISGNLLHMDATSALEHCQTLRVILTEPAERGKSNKCTAIVPQWESSNIYKYMRVPPVGTQSSKSKIGVQDAFPLRYVSRSHSDKNQAQQIPDYRMETEPSFKVLVEYLQALPKAHEEMGELLLRNGGGGGLVHNKKIPLIVQVCNKGQSELLMNFVCSAKARGLDTSRIFLFATDLYTYDLCQKLDLKFCYHNPEIFADMPENAAHHYADHTFAKMMMAKVYCVHLVLTMGYDVLFQDVDLVWYKDPLPYFATPDLQQWDVLFQDDGARTARYAPYSPNTGKYVLYCITWMDGWMDGYYILYRSRLFFLWFTHTFFCSFVHSFVLYIQYMYRFLFCKKQRQDVILVQPPVKDGRYHRPVQIPSGRPHGRH
jgi:hypothetical protein